LENRVDDLKESRKIISVADGRRHEVLGTIELPVLFDGVKRNTSFLVVPSLPHDLILGIDFCGLFRVVVDVSDGTVYSKLANHGALNLDEVLVPGEELEERQASVLNALIARFKCSLGREGLGCTNLYEHRIDTGDALPCRSRYHSYSPKLLKFMYKGLDEYLSLGVVEPSTSPWCSPVLLIPEGNGEYRWVVDLREVNKTAKSDAYRSYKVSDVTDQLRDARFLSSVDLKSAYFQIPLEKSSREKTAFMVPGRGLFHFRRLPQGLNSSSAAWQRFIDTVIGYDLQPKVFVYLDDIVVVSQTLEEHVELLETILSRLEKAGLTINFDKCRFCRSELKFLGYMVDREGLRVCDDKVKAVSEFPRPVNAKTVRRFIGLTSWYRRFVPNYATIMAPITDLTKGTKSKPVKFEWSAECESSFHFMKRCLMSAPILVCPNFQKKFFLQCDASQVGLGVILCQALDGSEVVAYASRRLSQAERLYTTTELECLCVIWGAERNRAYLEGERFTVVTDHASLLWLDRLKDPIGRLGRWVVRLRQFNFDIIHRKGKDHEGPDALSRAPVEDPVDLDREYDELDLMTDGPTDVLTAGPGKNFIELVLGTPDLEQTGSDLSLISVQSPSNDNWYNELRVKILGDPTGFSHLKVEGGTHFERGMRSS